MLNNHLKTCSSTDLKQFPCEKCENSIWHSATALRKHIAECHGLITTICDICGCTLKSKYYLDLKESLREELISIGINKKEIFIDNTCTYCEENKLVKVDASDIDDCL